MIQNPITFVLDASGNYLGQQRGTIRALSNYASKIYVVAPFESVALKVNYLVYGTQREVIGQYLAPTALYGRDVLASTDPNLSTASNWQVWEVSISQRALHRIAKYRSGRIGVSFQVLSIAQPSQALTLIDTLTSADSLPNPATYAGDDGDYYVSDVWNYTDQYIAGTFAKGTYFYFDTNAWVEGQNITYTVQTTTVDLAVDPSLLAELPADISEDAEITALIDELIGDVATLQATLDSHITDYTDPHDLQANQVEGTYRSSSTDVQTALDDVANELDGITDGQTDITYDPSADDIITADTVDGALGQLDDALNTHITDLTNPHEVTATQVNTTFNSSTVSVKNALDTLQATKVAKDPNTITSVSGSDKVYVNDGSEKLITVANLKTSIVEDLVAFGYVIFTEKDVDGQPVVASPQTNKIYLYNPDDSDIDNDQYEEWVYIDSAFELIGITGIALEDYYTKTETDDLLEIPLRLQLYPNTKNTSGSTIVKGAVVQFAGSQGDFIQIKEAVASEINADPSLLMGLAKDDILDNAFGDVVWFGNVSNIATGSFSLGDILWFDTVNGGLTNVEPTTDKIQVAAVEKASSTPSSTNGILLVRIKYVSRTIADVDGLQTALDGKVSKSGDTMTGTLTISHPSSTGILTLNAITDRNTQLTFNENNILRSAITYVAATDKLIFNNNGDKLTIQNDGNVGIGTTSPTAKLNIETGSIEGIALYRSGINANFNAIEFRATDNSSVNAKIGFNANELRLDGTSSTRFTIADTDAMIINSSRNVGIGTTSPQEKLDVNGNIALGGSRFIHKTGTVNTFVGVNTGNVNSSGQFNAAFGASSISTGTSGSFNAALGVDSLYSNNGNSNSAVGFRALRNNSTGSVNTAIGYQAGQYIANGSTSNTTGDYNTFIGADTKALADNDQNETVVGYNATGHGSNTVTLGNDNVTDTHLKGTVHTTSVKIGNWTLSEGATGSLDFTL